MSDEFDPDETETQVKVRLPAWLKRSLENAAHRSGSSINSEVIRRLTSTFSTTKDIHTLASSIKSSAEEMKTLAKYMEDDMKFKDLKIQHLEQKIRILEDKD